MKYGFGWLLIALCLGVLGVQAQTGGVAVYDVVVLNVYPHDPEAYTQGLLWHEGYLYESTGLRGASSLRKVDLTTGEVLTQVDVRRTPAQIAANTPPNEYFAEGLALVGDSLIQITWQESEALRYQLSDFTPLEPAFSYDGEGWGLCYDERYLYMSDGSQYLHLRDATTFERIVSFMVTISGAPIQAQLLNELECVGDLIYANLWYTDYIAMIDKRDGRVQGLVDASTLLTEEERAALAERDNGAVLNGIAYNPETETFYITGKKWDKLFEVTFELRE